MRQKPGPQARSATQVVKDIRRRTRKLHPGRVWNRILLENHYLPGALVAVGDFVDHDDHRRAHESLGNVTPADAYFGRAPAILKQRRKIRQRTIRQRRLLNKTQAA